MTNIQFLSNDNKGMIWQLLLDNNAFNNIPESNFNRVKQLYENTLNEISNLNNKNLTDKNKLTIQTMLQKLDYLKKTEISKPLQEVQIKLDKDFESKQEEFLKLVKRPTPEEIKFNEQNDEPLNANDMDNILSRMMKQRENEFNQVNLNNEKNSEESKNKIEVDPTKQHLTSDNNNSTDYLSRQQKYTPNKEVTVKEKRVSFETQDLDFIGKLKQLNKDNSKSEPSINNMLNHIIANQEKILQQLNILIER